MVTNNVQALSDAIASILMRLVAKKPSVLRMAQRALTLHGGHKHGAMAPHSNGAGDGFEPSTFGI
jgi:hypothetical protein